MIKFSEANAKLRKLAREPRIAKFLRNGRKVYSLDLLSGWSCPFAKDCHSKAVSIGGSRKIKDGPYTKYRCFSASQEVLYTNLYRKRKHNFEVIKELALQKGRLDLAKYIEASLPPKLGILRGHVGGDFFNQVYFDAFALVAHRNPDRLFYAYTKSLQYWVSRLGELPENLVLTASRGGMQDHLIEEYGLREAVVVFSVAEARRLKLKIDHNDIHAADPRRRHQNFALLIHGVQPKGSEAGKAVKALKGKGSYGRGK